MRNQIVQDYAGHKRIFFFLKKRKKETNKITPIIKFKVISITAYLHIDSS